MLRKGDLASRWLERIDTESEQLAADWGRTLDTIYLGGGTPSMLEDGELTRIAGFLQRDWGLNDAREVTMEADPLTFDARRLEHFRSLGFTRLSIGLQSTQDDVLKFLGRRHNGAEGLDAVHMALDAGFEVSADIITAVPGQDAKLDLERLIGTGVNHVSVYSLTVEPFTPFALRQVTVDEDKAADDFELATEVLSAAGLRRYEVSNHARPGHESRHNQVYWHGGHWLALGPSAASFLPQPGMPGVRRTNAPIRTWLLGDPGQVSRPDPVEYALERLMTGLRTIRGLDLDDVVARGGADVRQVFPGPLDLTLRHGLLEQSGAVLRATPDGLIRLDAVLREFFAARP